MATKTGRFSTSFRSFRIRPMRDIVNHSASLLGHLEPDTPPREVYRQRCMTRISTFVVTCCYLSVVRLVLRGPLHYTAAASTRNTERSSLNSPSRPGGRLSSAFSDFRGRVKKLPMLTIGRETLSFWSTARALRELEYIELRCSAPRSDDQFAGATSCCLLPQRAVPLLRIIAAFDAVPFDTPRSASKLEVRNS
jgi:hypothetical protein